MINIVGIGLSLEGSVPKSRSSTAKVIPEVEATAAKKPGLTLAISCVVMLPSECAEAYTLVKSRSANLPSTSSRSTAINAVWYKYAST